MGDEQRPQVTHSVFFLAPLGGTNGTKYKDLDWLLKACGYAVVFTSDKSSSSLSGRPPFLDNTPISSRYRYCLMELEEPAESLRIYDPAATSSFDWFLDPLSQATPRARVLAENVVALVILPNEAEGDEAALCPDFEYNSRTQKLWTTEQPKSLNQLPPALKVVMIAIDEASARRLQGTSDQPPDLGFSYDSVFQKAANLDADIKTVEEAFAARNIRYHVFQTVIPLRSSRWSAD